MMQSRKYVIIIVLLAVLCVALAGTLLFVCAQPKHTCEQFNIEHALVIYSTPREGGNIIYCVDATIQTLTEKFWLPEDLQIPQQIREKILAGERVECMLYTQGTTLIDGEEVLTVVAALEWDYESVEA